MFKFSSGCVRDSVSWECRCCRQYSFHICNICFVFYFFIVSPFHLIVIDVLFFLIDFVDFIVLVYSFLFIFQYYLYILLLRCVYLDRLCWS